MPNTFPRAGLRFLFLCLGGVQLAHADIYTWADETGTINVSNLAPPEGVKMIRVSHESAPQKIPPPSDAVGDKARPAEVQFLAERVRQLEQQVELANRASPPVQYQPMPAPPVVQYIVNIAAPNPAPVSYAPQPSYQPAYGCDPNWSNCDAWGGSSFYPGSYGCNPGWLGCGGWWGPGFYSPNVVVVTTPGFRRPVSPVRGVHPTAAQAPVRTPSGMRRG